MLRAEWDGWLWLLLSLGPLLFLQRKLHYEMQAVFLTLTRRVETTVVLFSILFFPGVLVHELSHYGMAKILRVKTGKISLIPEPTRRGKLRLGYVETAASDPIRDTLIGIAPLFAGGFMVALIGLKMLGFETFMQTFQKDGLVEAFRNSTGLISQPDYWIWFYLAFTISSMMLPSESDRKSWWQIVLWMGVLLTLSLVAGAGPWLLENVAPIFDQALTATAILFAASSLAHGVILLPFWGAHFMLRSFTGVEVQ